MINVFQELIPFSNKRLEQPISKDETYTNPIIMPFALDDTGGSNKLEVVFYIRNDSQSHYYTNILVSLMKDTTSATTPTVTDGFVNFNYDYTIPYLSLNGYSNIPAEVVYESASYNSSLAYTNKFYSNYMPVTDETMTIDNTVSVKFSFGYNELSDLDWSTKKSVLLIPNIGNKTMPDMSYMPVRMRMTWNRTPSLLTIRDYFIDITYQNENLVG